MLFASAAWRLKATEYSQGHLGWIIQRLPIVGLEKSKYRRVARSTFGAARKLRMAQVGFTRCRQEQLSFARAWAKRTGQSAELGHNTGSGPPLTSAGQPLLGGPPIIPPASCNVCKISAASCSRSVPGWATVGIVFVCDEGSGLGSTPWSIGLRRVQ